MGFAIGGVPPAGHLQPLVTILDPDLTAELAAGEAQVADLDRVIKPLAEKANDDPKAERQLDDFSQRLNAAANAYNRTQARCLTALDDVAEVDTIWVKNRYPRAYSGFLDSLEQVLEQKQQVAQAGTVQDVAAATDSLLRAERVMDTMKVRMRHAGEGLSEADLDLIANAGPRQPWENRIDCVDQD